MIDNNLESCVTCVTRPTLLQRLREKRQLLSTEIKVDASLLCVTNEKVAILQLPQLVLDWISICLNQGHIQPSQPCVGKLEGWPLRPYFKNSLYVDFECWCLKAKVPTYLIPSKELFYQGTDVVFESIARDRYQFPDLMICREKFSKLLKEAQYDKS